MNTEGCDTLNRILWQSLTVKVCTSFSNSQVPLINPTRTEVYTVAEQTIPISSRSLNSNPSGKYSLRYTEKVKTLRDSLLRLPLGRLAATRMLRMEIMISTSRVYANEVFFHPPLVNILEERRR